MSPYAENAVVDGAVGLLITSLGNRRNAMTVSWFSEAAHHPTTLWVSVDNQSLTRDWIEESRKFSLCVLHAGQKRMAEACGFRSGRDADKAAGLPLYSDGDGGFFLEGALSSTACRVRQSRTLGSHTLYIAEMLHGQCDTRSAIRRHLLISDFR